MQNVEFSKNWGNNMLYFIKRGGEIQGPVSHEQLMGMVKHKQLKNTDLIGNAQRGVPSLVDGYITTAAALLACRICPSVAEWLLFSHCSAEAAHALVLNSMKAQPLVDLDMRLGEGSGAGVALSLIQSALLIHSQMATFAEAGVSES